MSVKSYNVANGDTYPQGFPSIIYSATIEASTVQSFIIPEFSEAGQSSSGSQKRVVCIFSYKNGGNIWVGCNADAVTENTDIGTITSILNPSKLQFSMGDKLSFNTTDTSTYFSVAIYQYT